MLHLVLTNNIAICFYILMNTNNAVETVLNRHTSVSILLIIIRIKQ